MARKPQLPTDMAENDDEAEDQPVAEAVFREITYRSADGLELFARDYGDRLSPWLPVVCLAGLTRNSRDFHDLAVHLSTHRHRPRRVVAFDYRGRGRSQRAPGPESYNPAAEMHDIFDGMGALGIARAVVVGTSRGGIIGILMGVTRPASVAGLVLNDVGPKIEALGLARIKATVGGTPSPVSWPDAARLLRRLYGSSFTAWTDQDWADFARRTFRDDNGSPASDYDAALAETLDGLEFDQPIPDLWQEFRALKEIPILAIRGENSDLLAEDTLAAMQAAHPRIETITIAGEGHAPALRGGTLLARISAFITAIEGAAPPADTVVPRPEAGYDLDAAEETAATS